MKGRDLQVNHLGNGSRDFICLPHINVGVHWRIMASKTN